MDLTFAKCKEIFDTLPVGYYLGYSANAQLSETDRMSYCDLQSKDIVISYPMIHNAVIPLPSSTDYLDVETVIRSLLYHEISHVILTPTPRDWERPAQVAALLSSSDKIQAVLSREDALRIANIFEDERIETILRKYYKRTDFDKTVDLIIRPNYDPAEKDPVARFLAAVRLHKTTPEIMRKITDIIRRYMSVTRLNNDRTGVKYFMEVYKLFYEDFLTPYLEAKKFEDKSSEKAGKPDASSSKVKVSDPNPKNKTEPDDDPNDEESKDAENADNPENDSDSENESDSENDETVGDGSEDDDDDDEDASDDEDDEDAEEIREILNELAEMLEKNPEFAEQLMHAVTDHLFNDKEYAEIHNRVKRILQTAFNRHALHAPSANAWSGRLDPRLCGNRDYKWFTKRADGSGANRYSKIKINLFVDVSGSFCDSEQTINNLIQSLIEIERSNKDFSLDVIAMGMTNELLPKNKRLVTCTGGNKLDDSIIPVAQAVQTPNCRVFNVVVFDGDCQSDIYYPKRAAYKDVFKVFDTPNTIIVSDTENEDRIMRHNTSCKAIIISDNYAETFIDEVLKCLERALV